MVATVSTFAPYGDIREYATKLFENGGRGIGEKGKDNGALIVLALKERRVEEQPGRHEQHQAREHSPPPSATQIEPPPDPRALQGDGTGPK